MKLNKKKKVILMALAIVFALANNCFNYHSSNLLTKEKYSEIRDETRIKTSGYWFLDPIFIDGSDSGLGGHDWAWVEIQSWFGGGDGSWINPYIIENITINGHNSDSCIIILHSNVFFIIRNCTLYNSTYNNGNGAGIRLYDVNNSQIINNNLFFNNGNGIGLHDGNNNSFIGNTVNSNNVGLANTGKSANNLFYNNDFTNLGGINAIDNGTTNMWDDGFTGNSWDDYSGKDANDDGIGDTPYTIPGTAGSQDNFPIWWDAPVISIISPVLNASFQNTAPQFSISIEGVPDSMWYTIEGILGNLPFTELNFTIDQPTWDILTDGPITVTIYVQDSRNEIGTISIVIIKSIPSGQGIPIELIILISVISGVAVIGVAVAIAIILRRRMRGKGAISKEAVEPEKPPEKPEEKPEKNE